MVQVVLGRAAELNVRRVLGPELLRKALRGEGAHGALELLIQLLQGVLALAPGLRTKPRHWRPLFLRRKLRTLATNPPTNFYTEVGKVVEQLSVEYRRSDLDTTNLESVELRQAFDSLPECQ